jgi:hypothetical protein
MFSFPLQAAASLIAATTTTERFTNAAEVFQEIMQVAARAIPQEDFDKSECVVAPGLKRGAFGFGA